MLGLQGCNPARNETRLESKDRNEECPVVWERRRNDIASLLQVMPSLRPIWVFLFKLHSVISPVVLLVDCCPVG